MDKTLIFKEYSKEYKKKLAPNKKRIEFKRVKKDKNKLTTTFTEEATNVFESIEQTKKLLSNLKKICLTPELFEDQEGRIDDLSNKIKNKLQLSELKLKELESRMLEEKIKGQLKVLFK